ncbi:MAG: 6,7-dimethyl-8-ribityllumazine synthase [Bacteroidetes bacterium]|nr:6,7-dimethyl-8-ribityllumazine synthase [Bacteroidota bacterium]
MATNLKNLSTYNSQTIPKVQDMIIGIVVSEWNEQVTESLYKGALDCLIENGAKKENIIVKHVPGSFELVMGAQLVLENTDVDAVICLGCVIQGETRHFDFICNAVADGIMKLNTDYNTPVIFGVLTTNTIEQAQDRSGGKHGNKGIEAAITAIKMIAFQQDIEENS